LPEIPFHLQAQKGKPVINQHCRAVAIKRARRAGWKSFASKQKTGLALQSSGTNSSFVTGQSRPRLDSCKDALNRRGKNLRLEFSSPNSRHCGALKTTRALGELEGDIWRD